MMRALLLASAATLALLAPVSTDTAQADNPVPCDEAWQAPRSAGADDCRLRGWTVTNRFVLRPSNRVAYLRMNPCEQEDSNGPCFWNAQRQGNGIGTSFIIRGKRDGKHRVWFVKFDRS